MKQKKCPQCKNLISVEAPTCLFCGRPNKFVTNNYVKIKWEKKYNVNNSNFFLKLKQRKILIFLIITLFIILIFL